MHDFLDGHMSDVLNTEFTSPTSLPLYFYFGYQFLQEENRWQESGHVGWKLWIFPINDSFSLKRLNKKLVLDSFIDSLTGGTERKPLWLCEGVTRSGDKSAVKRSTWALCKGNFT